MSSFFLEIVNMSISASWIVLAVLLLRLLLKKAPKWIMVLLWGIVAVRLICPFSIESAMSLIPSSETINTDIMVEDDSMLENDSVVEHKPLIDTGVPIINDAVNPIIEENFSQELEMEPQGGISVTPLQIIILILSWIWMAGMVVMLAYTVISYLRVKRKIGTAVRLRENIFQSENVVSPFVLGVIKPRIYLPFDMNEQDMEHVIAHENAHIRRKDHLWKPFGFLLLTLHWFNPFIWLAYVLLCRDIELACDEKVVKEFDNQQKADYAQALVTCSVNRRMIAACPIAFGEVGVKDRVKSILNYKKPAFWIIIVAIIASSIAAVCFLTDPVSEKDTSALEESDATEQTNTDNPLEKRYELKINDDIEITQDYGVFQTDNTTPYEELITKTVDIHAFAQYFDIVGDGRGIDDVMEFIGVECLRETETGALYSVHKVEQGGLLYIFYDNQEWLTEIKTNGIKVWFYVRERVSSSDFASLQKNVSTIEDVIEIDEVDQIFLNCYRADPEYQYDGKHLYTVHYLEDGIYLILYELIGGELIFTDDYFADNFDLPIQTESRYYPYYAQVLEMDMVE